ncbi:MAG: hypothetical protein M1815_004202 [Lichina confinis]|nr:MAG: hypothetical protein M1815_004202 [Lichina confinis]
MAIGTLVLVASTWLAGTSASYASVNRLNVQVTLGTSPRPGHEELAHLTEGSIHPPGDECPVGHEYEWTCKDKGSYADDIYECPSLHGNTRVTPNHDYHKLLCNTQTHRHNVNTKVLTSTFVACVDICSENEKCVGVDWDRKTTRCWQKDEYITDTYPTISNKDVDSSSEQCPWYDPEEESCPFLNGKIRCDFGQQFKIFCKLALATTNLKAVDADTMSSCMEQCAAMPACKGADYNRVTKKCYTKSAYLDTPTIPNLQVDSIVLVERR